MTISNIENIVGLLAVVKETFGYFPNQIAIFVPFTFFTKHPWIYNWQTKIYKLEFWEHEKSSLIKKLLHISTFLPLLVDFFDS